jgi:predicted lipid-binding transport protein (Tim44 family)
MKSTSRMLTILTLALAGSLVVASPAAAGVGDVGGLIGGLLDGLGLGGILGGVIGG